MDNMDKVKVKKSIDYTTNPLINHIYGYNYDTHISCGGFCSFSRNKSAVIYDGVFSICIDFRLDPLSDCVMSLLHFSFSDSCFKVYDCIDINVKNFGISDFNIEKILNLVCRQPDSNLYGLQIKGYDLFNDYNFSCHVIYDFITQKLGLFGIPRYLWIDFILDEIETTIFEINGLTSSLKPIDSIHDASAFMDTKPLRTPRSIANYMLHTLENYADSYVKAQGWDKYVEL